ncbi:MAG: CotH kinase family protein, partial [Flavobacteriales bacterium]
VCVFDTPTPWESNEGSWCYDGIEPAPEVSLESGWYSGSQTATLIPTSATQSIHYSVNGDLPTTSHPYYFAPVQIESSSVLSARAFSTANMLPSKPADITCIIDEENHGLPVFSVITDSLNLWDFNEGIYVSGPNAQENFPFFDSNFWQPWSKWSRLEYFDGEQELRAKAEFDLEIHGGWSRAEPQKSFRFDFKSIYTGSLNYPVLSRKPYIEEHGNLNIRNGGQRLDYDKIQDAIFSRVASKTHVHNSSYDPCLVYLNGAYWGVYGIREKIDEQYLEDNFDVDENQVDLLNSWSVLAGTRSDFDQAYSALMNTSPDGESYYDLLDSEFELQNYIDYFAFETYIQNQDWMGIAWGLNNTKLWRSQQNGKWSYVMYDTDLAFGLFGGQPDDNYLQYARTPIAPSQHSMLFDRNLENEKFKCDFANRYADLVNTVFQSSEFNEEVDDLQALIADAMPDHIERWQTPFSLGYWNNTVQQIKTYNALRVPTAREHVNNTLGFDGQVQVTLNVVPAGAGSVQISTVTPDEYPWQGVYFNGCPVNISVMANEGYDFDHWEDNAFIAEGEEINDSLLVNIQTTASFIAHFSQCNLDAEVLVSAEVNELSYSADGIELVEEVTWFLNGVEVGNGETFEALQSGIYSVLISSGNCTFNSNELIFSHVGISEQEEASLSVWPNPASNEIRITSPNMDLNSAILEIWSSSGQLVHRQARPKSSVSIAHLSAGVYQVKLSDGKVREVLMLVVE